MNIDICLIKFLDMLDKIFWTFRYVGNRTKQILCEILNTELCRMRKKTNYIKIIGHRDLDEKHLTRQITSELLDIEICWMTNIGRLDGP